ncbi:unnamed protein product [Prunus armeniaca]
MQDLVLEVYGSKFQVTILQQAFHSYPACDYFKMHKYKCLIILITGLVKLWSNQMEGLTDAGLFASILIWG